MRSTFRAGRPHAGRGGHVHALSEAATVHELGSWARHLAPYDEVVGFSDLGLFFLRDSESLEYAILHPFQPALKAYGRFTSPDEFEAVVLRDPAFVQAYLRPDDLERLNARLGPLGEQEIYFPTPYPHLGGDDSLDTYDKGDVLVFAEIVAQTHGMDDC